MVTATTPQTTDNTSEIPEHDYFAELDARISILKSIQGEFDHSDALYKQHLSVNLAGTKEKIMQYLVDLQRNESKLLSVSKRIRKLRDDLQLLVSDGENTPDANAQKESKTSFDPYFESLIIKPDSSYRDDLKRLINAYEQLQVEKKIEAQHIQLIQTLIDFEEKQLHNNAERRTNTTKLLKKKLADSPSHHSYMQTQATLLSRINEDQNHIKEIQQNLQNEAEIICHDGEYHFSHEIQQKCLDEFKSIHPKLEDAIYAERVLKMSLLSAMNNMKKEVQQEKARIALQEAAALAQVAPKTPEERIQQAFDMALNGNENLVLEGQHRSLGFTNDIVKKIDEDKMYKKDIIAHILKVLQTPHGEAVKLGGQNRWKNVHHREGLKELAISPKSGNAEGMPRFYAKSEVFISHGKEVILTNTQEHKQGTFDIWVLVRKGEKGDQNNDMDTAEKYRFKNDGTKLNGAIANDLPWMKIEIDGSNPNQLGLRPLHMDSKASTL